MFIYAISRPVHVKQQGNKSICSSSGTPQSRKKTSSGDHDWSYVSQQQRSKQKADRVLF